MIVYHYDKTTGEYIGQSTAFESPLEPGKYLIPAHSTPTAPPFAGGKNTIWRDGWILEDIPAPEVESEVIPSLPDTKTAKLHRINDAKNTYLDGGFLHNGVLFDSDSKARLAYIEFAHKLTTSPLYSTPWKASAGVWVTMDATLFTALQPAYQSHISACFAWQAAREMEVAAAMALENEAVARAALEAVSEVM